MLTEQQKKLLDSINFAILTGESNFPIFMMNPFDREECAEYLGWETGDRPDLVKGFVFTGLGDNPRSVEFDPSDERGGWEHVHPLTKGTSVGIGAPHSGTHFLARVKGWHHERYFFPLRNEPLDYETEVSWMAAPFVNPEDTHIIHIVREPLKVISSLVQRNWLALESDYAAKLAYDHTGTRDPFEFYIKWFWMCHEKAHETVRLEDIQHLGDNLNRTDPPLIDYSDVPSRLLGDIISISELNNYPT